MSDEEPLEIEEIDSTKPSLLPWFKLWANRWMSSPNVDGTTLNQLAIFVRNLCGRAS